MRQFPRREPVLFVGAAMGMEMFVSALTATAEGNVNVVPLICSPPTNVNLNPASQAQEPVLTTFQVLVKDCPGAICVLSGMVTSLTKRS
jgi:hypothetical protein